MMKFSAFGIRFWCWTHGFNDKNIKWRKTNELHSGWFDPSTKPTGGHGITIGVEKPDGGVITIANASEKVGKVVLYETNYNQLFYQFINQVIPDNGLQTSAINQGIRQFAQTLNSAGSSVSVNSSQVSGYQNTIVVGRIYGGGLNLRQWYPVGENTSIWAANNKIYGPYKYDESLSGYVVSGAVLISIGATNINADEDYVVNLTDIPSTFVSGGGTPAPGDYSRTWMYVSIADAESDCVVGSDYRKINQHAVDVALQSMQNNNPIQFDPNSGYVGSQNNDFIVGTNVYLTGVSFIGFIASFISGALSKSPSEMSYEELKAYENEQDKWYGSEPNNGELTFVSPYEYEQMQQQEAAAKQAKAQARAEKRAERKKKRMENAYNAVQTFKKIFLPWL